MRSLFYWRFYSCIDFYCENYRDGHSDGFLAVTPVFHLQKMKIY